MTKGQDSAGTISPAAAADKVGVSRAQLGRYVQKWIREEKEGIPEPERRGMPPEINDVKVWKETPGGQHRYYADGIDAFIDLQRERRLARQKAEQEERNRLYRR